MPLNVSVKWFHDGAFRRFGLELNENMDAYQLLVKKIKSIFPTFALPLAWKDSEGDLVVCSTDGEIREAIRDSPDMLLRIYTIAPGLTDANKGQQHVQVVPVAVNNVDAAVPESPRVAVSNAEVVHPNITCDICNMAPIAGPRFKCVVCADFDLCEKCDAAGHHKQHAMVRIMSPADHSWKPVYWRNHRGIHGCEHGRPCNPPQPRESTPSGIAYLKAVGENVASALANLGINVDVDIEHEGEREKIVGHQPVAQPDQQQAAAPVETPVLQTEVLSPVDVPSETENQWTLLDTPLVPPTNTTVTAPNLYPTTAEMQVQAATTMSDAEKTLHNLLAMGFTNEGGWLSALVAQKEGDINAVLNTLNPRQ